MARCLLGPALCGDFVLPEGARWLQSRQKAENRSPAWRLSPDTPACAPNQWARGSCLSSLQSKHTWAPLDKDLC